MSSETAPRVRFGDHEVVLAPGPSQDLFPGQPATYDAVRSALMFHRDESSLALLRHAVIEEDGTAASLSDDDMLELVARQVELGRWQIEPHIEDHPPIDPPHVVDLSDLVEPSRPEPVAEQKHWVEIELVDENDEPVIGARYRIELPGGSVVQGRTGDGGTAYHGDLSRAGTCKVSFPDFDTDAWDPA